MKEQIELRISELKSQLETGQKAMEELEVQRSSTMYALLRISGAIQVLEELEPEEEADGKTT